MKQDLPRVARGKFLDRRAVRVAQSRRPGAPGPCVRVGGNARCVERLKTGVQLQQVAASGTERSEVACKRVRPFAVSTADELIKQSPQQGELGTRSGRPVDQRLGFQPG